jgi:hypothetical protein
VTVDHPIVHEASGKRRPAAFEVTVEATGNGPQGRGARGAIPLLLKAQAGSVQLGSGDSLTWTVRVATGDAPAR